MSEWQPLAALPDLRRVGIIAIDTETRDDGLRAKRGPGWPWGGGYVVGASVAYRADGGIRTHYFPIRHPDSHNFDPAQLFAWLEDLVASDVRIITKNGLYDWGWLRADAGLKMPPAERLEEIDALATIVDENRRHYNLDALCAWRGFPGKDATLLLEGCATLGLIPARARKTFKPQSVLWQLPAHFVGPYAETDAVRTLELFESLDPVLDREDTRDAYRLEIDLLPMVHAMRRRGIRVDIAAVERARKLLLQKRDVVLIQIGALLGSTVSMTEIRGRKWLIATFDRAGIAYPRTAKGNPSFKGGTTGWMRQSTHPLPPLIAAADRLDNYAENFLKTQILGHVVNGRVYAEINPHRSDAGGARSLRFSYAHPPLQQMPKHDTELAPLVRAAFLPEDGEVWAECDISQQEFRLVTHYAARHKLPRASETVERYRNDPATDFHALVATWTSIDRQSAKNSNFARIYGAGLRKFAEMIRKTEAEASEIWEKYERELPFVSRLCELCQHAAQRTGYLTLYNGARRHFDLWAPGGRWQEGAGPCERDEALRRTRDPGHPWYGQRLWRADTRKALNALIQGSAAIHTKLWMRAVWRASGGRIVPLLQMHDSLGLSVSSPADAELVARLGCEAVQLEVPMKVDIGFGHTWGDAKHTWEELHAETSHRVEPVGEIPAAPAPAPSEVPEFSNDSGSDEMIPEIAAIASDDASTPAPLAAAAIKIDMPPLIPRPASPPSGNGRGGPDGFDGFVTAAGNNGGGAPRATGSKTAAERDTYAEEHAGEPFSDADLRAVGYRLARVFDYALADGTLLYQQNRYELPPGAKPTKKRPRKRFRPHHRANGVEVAGAPERRVLYNWPAIMRAAPSSFVFVTEGEANAAALIGAGLLATTVLSHKWTPECGAALTGHHLIILADHDDSGKTLAANAQKKLAPVAASTRIVPAAHLWTHLAGAGEPAVGDDVQDWIARGGDPQKLLDICREIPINGILESVCATEIEIEDYDWIWPGRFALKKIGLIVGLPDEGKGLTITDIMARITRGLPWPCNEGNAPLGNVILLTAEDDLADTIVPRLIAADADLKRVTIVKMMRDAGKERMFSLVTDLDALRQKVVEVGDVRMILIDPVTAYFGVDKIDSFRATDVRAVLGPLKQFAEELRVAILGIMHFNKKIDVTNIMLRVSDSLAYSAAARHVYAVVNDPDNHRRLLVRGKNNLADPEQKTLAFDIEKREVGTSKSTGAPILRPHVVWHPEPVDITPAEAMQAAAESKSPGARDNAKEFLKALLSDGPVGAKEIREAAKENGIAKRTLERAQQQLRIDPKKDGPKNEKGEVTWRWHLPPQREE